MGHNRPVTTDVKEDAVLRDAQGLAHDAVVDEMGAQLVGSPRGFAMEAERFGTHAFACDDPAYVGWQWAVSVSRVPRGKAATICEIILLPGPKSLVAPEWVPWSDRIRPGDLGVGDVLPTPADDARLVTGMSGADEIDAIIDRDEPRGWTGWEVGLGRARVLSIAGRDQAADRWDDGDFGPRSEISESASKEF